MPAPYARVTRCKSLSRTHENVALRTQTVCPSGTALPGPDSYLPWPAPRQRPRRNSPCLGLDTTWGKVDLGRLQLAGAPVETLVRVDPLKGAGLTETVWPGVWTGVRFDNAVRYRYENGPAFAGVLWAFGERAAQQGRTWAVTAGYLATPTLAMAGYQENRDGTGLRNTVWTAGLTWPLDTVGWRNAIVHAALMRARRDAGFTIGSAAGTALFNGDLGYAGNPAPAAQDTRVLMLGLTFQPAPLWRLRNGLFLARSPHATLFNAVRGGSQQTLYSVLSYDLSKRTALLLSVDFNRWNGGWSGYWGASAASLLAYQPDGSSGRRTAAVGMQHNF